MSNEALTIPQQGRQLFSTANGFISSESFIALRALNPSLGNPAIKMDAHNANAVPFRNLDFSISLSYDRLLEANIILLDAPSKMEKRIVATIGASQKPVEADKELETIFNGLAKKWKEETRGYSTTFQKYAHPAYQSILVLGPDAVPYILKDLQANGGRWFEALRALTKRDDIVTQSDSYDEAVKKWIAWGEKENII